jgi:hypothetical protein
MSRAERDEGQKGDRKPSYDIHLSKSGVIIGREDEKSRVEHKINVPKKEANPEARAEVDIWKRRIRVPSKDGRSETTIIGKNKR